MNAEIHVLPLDQLKASKTNPRQTFDKAYIEDLAGTIKDHGVLQPILVRPSGIGKGFEIVAGECRFRASKLAGKEEIPVTVRDLTDEQTLEIQVIENLKRRDLHALEEARGYKSLLKFGHSVERVAEQIKLSPKYVYDRMKLLDLTPALQKQFLENEFTPGHAIILARLKPEDQTRAADRKGYDSGLFEQEHTLFDPRERGSVGGGRGLKLKSIRELQAWVDEHVRLEATDPALPQLFPETHKALAEVHEEAAPLIHVTFLYDHERPGKKKGAQGETIHFNRDWREASGRDRDSKKCKHSVTGFLALGPGRGGTIEACIDRACPIHWPKQKESARRSSASDEKWRAKLAKQEKARRQKELENAALRRELMGALVTAAEGKLIGSAEAGLWVAIALGAIVRGWHETLKDVCTRRGILKPGGQDLTKTLCNLVEESTPAQARAIAVEVIVGPSIKSSSYSLGSADSEKLLGLACRTLAVDRAGITRRVRKELAAKGKPARAKKPGGPLSVDGPDESAAAIRKSRRGIGASAPAKQKNAAKPRGKKAAA